MHTSIRGFLLATTAGWIIAPSAEAADSQPVMPIKAAPFAVAPSWVGPYWGLHLGAGLQQTHTNLLRDFNHYAPTISHLGVIAGGQIGYNWQRGNLIYGLVADASFLSGKSSEITWPDDELTRSRVRWLATLRGKFGLAAGDTMPYITAGLAVGGVRNEYVEIGQETSAHRATRAGIAVGGGIEHMFGPNWTAFLEGLFVDLGKHKVKLFGENDNASSFRNQVIIVRAGVNKRF